MKDFRLVFNVQLTQIYDSAACTRRYLIWQNFLPLQFNLSLFIEFTGEMYQYTGSDRTQQFVTVNWLGFALPC